MKKSQNAVKYEAWIAFCVNRNLSPTVASDVFDQGYSSRAWLSKYSIIIKLGWRKYFELDFPILIWHILCIYFFLSIFWVHEYIHPVLLAARCLKTNWKSLDNPTSFSTKKISRSCDYENTTSLIRWIELTHCQRLTNIFSSSTNSEQNWNSL